MHSFAQFNRTSRKKLCCKKLYCKKRAKMYFGMRKELILVTILGFVAASLQDEGGLRTDEEIYREMDGTYEQVGDMIFEKDSAARMASANHPNWPRGIVPYVISENVTSDLRPVIEKAVKYINKYTCLQLRPQTNSDEYWLRFLMKENASPNAVCSSYVGWLNRRDQGVFLGPKCFVGSMVHELLHAVGFFHEHTRNDRDKYIKVNATNFADDVVARNYALDKASCAPGTNCKFNDYGVKYNYESIMHYCTYCGSKDPAYPVFTIIKGTDGVGDSSKIGQREGFSDGDWGMVNRKYECDTSVIPHPKPISAKPIVQTPEDEENFTLPPFTLFPPPTTPTTPTVATTPAVATTAATTQKTTNDGTTPPKKVCKKTKK